MRELASFFENPFSRAKIGRDRKQAFGNDSLQRIAVQNTNGQFDHILNKTEAVQTTLFGGITSLDTTEAIRKARTQSVDKIMKDFIARNSRLNAYFIASGTDKEDMYIEFFPQGVQAFTRDVKKENIEAKMKAMVDAVTANTAVAGGAGVLKEYTDLFASYKKARGDQQAKTGQIDSGITSLNNTEAVWDDQMFSNLLDFAQLNRDKPDNIKLYMDPSLLEPDAHHDTTLTGKIKGTVTNADGHLIKNVLIHVAGGKMSNAHTDENGAYETHPLPIGKWQIEYSKGDKKAVKEVDIKEGDVLVIDVVLGE